MECKLEKVPNYRGKWIASEEKSKYPSRNIRSSAARNIQNAAIEPLIIIYAIKEYLYAPGDSQIIR